MENVTGLKACEVPDFLKIADSVLLIDCRPFIAFNCSSIVDSVNIHCPTILKRRSGGFVNLENIVPCELKRSRLQGGEYRAVLVYDETTQDTEQAASDSNILAVIKSLLKLMENLNVKYIVGGFEAVQEECPLLCIHSSNAGRPNRDRPLGRDRRPSPCKNEPAEILPHLYLGDSSHSSRDDLLQRLGMTALLNVSSSCHNHFETNFRYMNLPVNDNMTADLLSWFPKLFQFIDDIAAEQGKVLVHCRAGVSRSATVCIAYLMQKQGISLDAAFEQVMLKRPIIDPNLNFIQQLQKFEKQLKENLTIPSTAYLKSDTPNIGSTQLFNFPQPFTNTNHINSTSFFEEVPMETQNLFRPSSSSFLSTEPRCITQEHSHKRLKLDHLPSSTYFTGSTELSPSSLSQTAASPNPARNSARRSRPASLPLQQNRATYNLDPEQGSTPESLMAPFPPAIFSPSHLLKLAQPPTDLFGLNSFSVPKTPSGLDTSFSFFEGDPTCRAAPITPRSSTFLDTNELDTARSPLSPIGVPLSPLSSL